VLFDLIAWNLGNARWLTWTFACRIYPLFLVFIISLYYTFWHIHERFCFLMYIFTIKVDCLAFLPSYFTKLKRLLRLYKVDVAARPRLVMMSKVWKEIPYLSTEPPPTHFFITYSLFKLAFRRRSLSVYAWQSARVTYCTDSQMRSPNRSSTVSAFLLIPAFGFNQNS
jgi:hypothetical protein